MRTREWGDGDGDGDRRYSYLPPRQTLTERARVRDKINDYDPLASLLRRCRNTTNDGGIAAAIAMAVTVVAIIVTAPAAVTGYLLLSPRPAVSSVAPDPPEAKIHASITGIDADTPRQES